jgi:hypothetical protein
MWHYSVPSVSALFSSLLPGLVESADLESHRLLRVADSRQPWLKPNTEYVSVFDHARHIWTDWRSGSWQHKEQLKLTGQLPFIKNTEEAKGQLPRDRSFLHHIIDPTCTNTRCDVVVDRCRPALLDDPQAFRVPQGRR